MSVYLLDVESHLENKLLNQTTLNFPTTINF